MKKKAHPIGWYQRKADTLLQEVGKSIYSKCEVCGKPMSCLHHFFPKSISARLRYDWDNLIPICQGCHMRHHQAGDPRIHETIKQKKGGLEWYEALRKRGREIIKVNREYYEQQMEKLKEMQ